MEITGEKFEEVLKMYDEANKLKIFCFKKRTEIYKLIQLMNRSDEEVPDKLLPVVVEMLLLDKFRIQLEEEEKELYRKSTRLSELLEQLVSLIGGDEQKKAFYFPRLKKLINHQHETMTKHIDNLKEYKATLMRQKKLFQKYVR